MKFHMTIDLEMGIERGDLKWRRETEARVQGVWNITIDPILQDNSKSSDGIVEPLHVK